MSESTVTSADLSTRGLTTPHLLKEKSREELSAYKSSHATLLLQF